MNREPDVESRTKVIGWHPGGTSALALIWVIEERAAT
jgi:hypothetical protein